MKNIHYNIKSDKPCRIAWTGEQNATLLTFDGYHMDDDRNALYLILDNYAVIPLVDYSLVINQPLSADETVFYACLQEVKGDGEEIYKSEPFMLVVEYNAAAGEEYEAVDVRLDLVYAKYNKLYNELDALGKDLQHKIDTDYYRGRPGEPGTPGAPGYTPVKGVDYFDGKDGYTPVKGKDYFDGAPGAPGTPGKDYQITDADYEAIAERTKELVPPYDDAQIKKQIADVNESVTELDNSLDALWKMNRGQTYDVIESTSEDYSKQIPSGSKYASVDMVGGKSIVWNQQSPSMMGTPSSLPIGEWVWASQMLNDTVTDDGDSYRCHEVGAKQNGFQIIARTQGVYRTYLYPKGGHKYYIKFYARRNNEQTPSINARFGNVPLGFGETNVGEWAKREVIVTPTASLDSYFLIWAYSKEAVELDLSLRKDAIIVDLTQLFGSDNEPTSVDDIRIKQIEAYASEHPEFNSGEILSSRVDDVEVQGANLIDFDDVARNVLGGTLQENGYYKIVSAAGVPIWTNEEGIGGRFYLSYDIINATTQRQILFSVTYTDGSVEPYYPWGSGSSSKEIWTNASKTVSRIAVSYGVMGYYEIKDVYLAIANGIYKPYSKTTIPTSFPTLRSAGTVYDYIDIEKGELHRRVGVQDMGSLGWTEYGTIGGASHFWYTSNRALASHIKHSGTSDVRKITSVVPIDYIAIINESVIRVYSENLTSAPSGLLYYELATEIIEPITIPQDLTEWLEVEANGSITFVNDGKLLVPNTERFVRKLNEVT